MFSFVFFCLFLALDQIHIAPTASLPRHRAPRSNVSSKWRTSCRSSSALERLLVTWDDVFFCFCCWFFSPKKASEQKGSPKGFERWHSPWNRHFSVMQLLLTTHFLVWLNYTRRSFKMSIAVGIILCLGHWTGAGFVRKSIQRDERLRRPDVSEG